MEHRTAIVTGASAGIGRAAAAQLLDAGWRVIGIGRDPLRTADTAAALASPRFTMLRADLSSLVAIAGLAAELLRLAPRIDALLNVAGGVQAERRTTAEGFEVTFAANHLAPFMLTTRLLPALLPGGRVIAVSSSGHEYCRGLNWDDLDFTTGWLSGAAYCQAKLANILFTRELARRYGPEGLVAHAMHPGVVDSNFASHCDAPMKAHMEAIRPEAVAPEVPARTLCWLAGDPAPALVNGRYFHAMAEAACSVEAQDDAAAARLWQVSAELTAAY
ncbi:SDR family NAD(P)-dependent oxidoreductase [Novosphingobium piscinae]|uniref:SDR family NAD(P)-dependent oxidoreductase n=1 Tax=Novosphingobium piscinae TaxID=1507448 RepID=A0A7X1FVI7_9SPHN|nr:SDR family NAD(P)-dependent oxidoreductase [Novosphingobium piscinae]MBC2667746.1 SDR family NAD(P)-dependent oxidoreductase [Novosphingobium piscinae]